MSYELFKFGSLYIDEVEVPAPEIPTSFGDIYHVYSEHKISIRDSDAMEPITWIQPEGMNLMIADRVLLARVSWTWLKKNGLIDGKVVSLKGLDFKCRLPQVGGKDEYSEWDRCLDCAETDDDDLWHWRRMMFWGRDAIVGRNRFHFACGFVNPRERTEFLASTQESHIGFRPVLELCMPELLPMEWNICLEGQQFAVSVMKTGRANAKTVGLRLALLPKPAGSVRIGSAFWDAANFSRVEAYTLLMDGQPVQQDLDQPVKYKAGATLTLTDEYFGEEYLSPWVITQTGAYAERAILRAVKVQDLQGQTFV